MTKLITPSIDCFLAYVNNVGDNDPKEATPEILDQLLDADSTRRA